MSLAIDSQQQAPYMFTPHILILNSYAVLLLLICSLSGHRPEDSLVHYLETHGALNIKTIQGISQFLLVIQSVQLRNPQSSFPFQIDNLNIESKSPFNSDNTSF